MQKISYIFIMLGIVKGRNQAKKLFLISKIFYLLQPKFWQIPKGLKTAKIDISVSVSAKMLANTITHNFCSLDLNRKQITLNPKSWILLMITVARVQRKPLNVIIDNVVIQLMWSICLRLTKSQVMTYLKLCISNMQLIVTICLMLSLYLGPVVISLSGFHCIWKFHFLLWW
jgi:hypothetical protein